MKIKKYFTWRVILLISVILISMLIIAPKFSIEGLEISKVSGEAFNSGLREGDIIKEMNGIAVNDIKAFNEALEKATNFGKKTITVETNLKTETYEVINSIGFRLKNLTIISIEKGITLDVGSEIISINSKKINNSNDFLDIEREIIKETKFSVKTNKVDAVFLSVGKPDIQVKIVERTNIKKGLDLVGGTRVLLKPEEALKENQIESLISILSNRLDVYGLTDLKIRSAKDLEGETFILAEIAGATREEVETLIAQQGKFEAKIGNEIVFEGGKKDIPFVCRGDGSCSGVVPPCSSSSGQASCRFEFTIRLSAEAAKRHATITKGLKETIDGYLEKDLDLYLDNNLVDSLKISDSLKGQEATAIVISGPGFGSNQEEAYKNALESMDKLQTVLITGSLPQKLEIIKIDSISPVLGEEFTKNIYYVILAAFFGVGLVLFLRYRKLKIVLPILVTLVSEIVITLSFAALIEWSLDLVSIAGIIATVSTGVNDQIVIIDETLKKELKEVNWKIKLKRAFFVILTAYVTTVAAMIPLWNAGAGLLRGLALTTIVGLTAGVFITRPAFASFIEKLLEE